MAWSRRHRGRSLNAPLRPTPGFFLPDSLRRKLRRVSESVLVVFFDTTSGVRAGIPPTAKWLRFSVLWMRPRWRGACSEFFPSCKSPTTSSSCTTGLRPPCVPSRSTTRTRSPRGVASPTCSTRCSAGCTVSSVGSKRSSALRRPERSEGSLSKREKGSLGPPALRMTTSLQKRQQLLDRRRVFSVGVELQVLLEVLLGRRLLVQVEARHSQQIVGIRVVGFGLDDLGQRRLGVLHFSLVVSVDSLVVEDLG